MTDTISTHYPEPEGRSTSTRSDATRNSVTCSICQAGYAPAQTHEYLLQAPHVALESAFMSMCHFCFRCRRPACPSCWDYIHGVCGACALEARLPFRSPSTPLQGVLFPPIRRTQLGHRQVPRLICVRPGKFQHVAPIDSAETALIETIATENIPHHTNLPASTADSKTTARPSPQRIPPSTTQSRAIPNRVNIDEIVTRPEPPNTTNIDKVKTRPEPHNTINLDEIATKPELPNTINIDEIKTRPEPHNSIPVDEIATRPGRSIGRQIERVMISILFVLLLFIVTMIILASVSQDANTIILKITHIDIRVEIAYILQLIRQVFS